MSSARIIPLNKSASLATSRRQAFLREWLTNATDLAHASQDAEAQTVAEFLRQHGALGVALPHDGVAYLPASDIDLATTVFIIPMTSMELWRLPPDDQWLDLAQYAVPKGGRYGVFRPVSRAIYLGAEWSFSSTWRGLQLLHEGLHAYDWIIRKQHKPKPAWRRERNATVLEYRVLCAIGGQQFLDYLDRLVPVASRQYEARPDHLPLIDQHDLERSVLSRLFGAPSSRSELIDRDHILATCVFLRYLMTATPRSWQRRFDQYIRSQYDSWGVPTERLPLQTYAGFRA